MDDPGPSGRRFVAANLTKLIDAGWFPPLLASSIASLMLTWRIGWQLLEQERSKPRRREDEFSEGAVTTPLTQKVTSSSIE